MPADSNQIRDARVTIKNLLKDCDTFLASHMGKSNSSLERAVKRVRVLYGLLKFESLEHVPEEMVRDLGQYAKDAHSAFGKAITMSDEGDGIGSVRSGFDREIDTAYEAAFGEVMSVASYQVSSIGLDKMKQEMDMFRENEQQSAEERQKKFDALYKNMVEVAPQQAVSEQMAAFREEANDGKKAAKNWLWACGASVGLLLVTVWSALDLPDMDSTGAVVFYVATRLAAFYVFVYALLFCARNYAAHRHNYVVNKHRYNALRTYRAFIEASPTAETRDIVLMQAARCIYEQRDSGYAKSGGNDGNTVNLSPMGVARAITKAADDK